ncbi:methyl-accepting chemotaxis protein [Effusibacillus consociatus]|uniref:Methyl-accepting chemotaxis protein n=1 Tax=Effusibacillus consociatus TaxID=1117041 RepID=A0ABV9Q2I2_9BACL
MKETVVEKLNACWNALHKSGSWFGQKIASMMRQKDLFRRKSLGTQLSFAVAGFMVIAVLATGGQVYFQSEKEIRSLVVADLQRSASMMNEKVNIMLATIDSTSLAKEIEYIMAKEGARLTQKGWEPKQWMITADGGKAPIKQAQEDLDKEVVDQILQHKTGVLEIERNGETRTVTYQQIPEKGWFYVLEVLEKGYLAPVNKVRSIALSIAVVVLVGSVLLIFWLVGRMLKPLSTIQTVMDQVAAGNLRVRMEESNAVKEVAEVGAGLNSMVQKMEGMIRVLDRGIESGKEASDSLLHVVEKNREQFKNTVIAMQEIGSGAQQQASAVDLSASRMEEMSGQANQLVGVMQETSGITEQMKTDIGQGLTVVGRNAERMHQVAGLTEELDATVRRLVEGLQQIRGILTSIQGIADQTNLLALNASIEAARAGEAGRGFAVVAQEVRVLADQSKKAAEQILRFTQSIENEAANAVKATAIGKREVDEGLSEAMRAKEAMVSISEGINSTQSMVAHMVNVIEGWAAQVQELENSLTSVREVSRDTLTTAEQVKTISENQMQEVKYLQQATEQLVTIMNQLDDETRQFSI